MNRITSTLRVPWAGPAVLSVLIALAVTPRTAIATPPPPPPLAAATAIVTTAKLCYTEAAAYINAWAEYIEALQDYYNSLPGGTESEIMDAARRLDEAASKVWDTGWKLILCMGQYIF